MSMTLIEIDIGSPYDDAEFYGAKVIRRVETWDEMIAYIRSHQKQVRGMHTIVIESDKAGKLTIWNPNDDRVSSRDGNITTHRDTYSYVRGKRAVVVMRKTITVDHSMHWNSKGAIVETNDENPSSH
jgi:hypothetical protein